MRRCALGVGVGLGDLLLAVAALERLPLLARRLGLRRGLVALRAGIVQHALGGGAGVGQLALALVGLLGVELCGAARVQIGLRLLDVFAARAGAVQGLPRLRGGQGGFGIAQGVAVGRGVQLAQHRAGAHAGALVHVQAAQATGHPEGQADFADVDIAGQAQAFLAQLPLPPGVAAAGEQGGDEQADD